MLGPAEQADSQHLQQPLADPELSIMQHAQRFCFQQEKEEEEEVEEEEVEVEVEL